MDFPTWLVNKTKLSVLFTTITENTTSQSFGDISHRKRKTSSKVRNYWESEVWFKVALSKWRLHWECISILIHSPVLVETARWGFEEIQRIVWTKLLMLSIEEMVGLLGSSHNELFKLFSLLWQSRRAKKY